MTSGLHIRSATPADLPFLQEVEAAGDAMFADLFGPEPFGPDSAETGEARAAEPGLVLVALEVDGDDGDEGARASGQELGRAGRSPGDTPVVGFAHVLETAGEAHLEQLAVLPSHGRRGIGTALVEAACTEARRHGFTRITLRTYAEVPWNAPFYERCGFHAIAPSRTEFQRSLVETEHRLGLERHGPRVLMERDLTAER